MLPCMQFYAYIATCIYREKYRSEYNQMILHTLIEEVKTFNESFEVEQVKGS